MADEKTASGETDDPNGGKKGSVEDQPDKSSVKQRLAKLEKIATEQARALDEERKASAGKDRKITELADEKRKLQETTLSKDKLLEIREQEQKEREREWAEKNAAERMELEQLRIKALRQEVLTGLDNFPMAFADRIRGTNKEEIETDARWFMNKWIKDRTVADNARKVIGKPQSGSGKQAGTATIENIKAMTPEQRKEFFATAPKEERNRMFDELAAEGLEA